MSDIFDYIRTGDIESLNRILIEHTFMDITEERNSEKDTPLTYAITRGELEIVKLLLERAYYYPKGAQNLTPHQLAQSLRHTNPAVYDEIIAALNRAKNEQSNPEHFKSEFLHSLLVNPELSFADLEKIFVKRPDLKEISQFPQGDTPLITAAKTGNRSLVEFLLAQQVDFFNPGRTSHMASYWAELHDEHDQHGIAALLNKIQRAALLPELAKISEGYLSDDYLTKREHVIYTYAQKEISRNQSELQQCADKNSPAAAIFKKIIEELSVHVLLVEIRCNRTTNLAELIAAFPLLANKPLRNQEPGWLLAMRRGHYLVAQSIFNTPSFDILAVNAKGLSVLKQVHEILKTSDLTSQQSKTECYTLLIKLGLKELNLPAGVITEKHRAATALLVLQYIFKLRGLETLAESPLYLEEMQELLTKFPVILNTPCDDSDERLLDVALAGKRTQDIKILLERGADCSHLPLERVKDGFYKDWTSVTYTEINATNKQLQATMLQQAYINRKRAIFPADTETLHYCAKVISSLNQKVFYEAIKTNNLQMVLLILEHNGALLETEFHNRYLPLGLAAYYGRNEIITALLQKGADPFKRDGDRRIARSYASNTNVEACLFQAELQTLKTQCDAIPPTSRSQRLAAMIGLSQTPDIRAKYQDLALEALRDAVSKDRAKLVKISYEHRPELFHKLNSTLARQLHIMVDLGSYQVAKQLYELNADLLSRYGGQTPREYAEAKILELLSDSNSSAKTDELCARISRVITYFKVAELKNAKQQLPRYQQHSFAFLRSKTIKELQHKNKNFPIEIFKDAIKFGFLDLVQQLLVDYPEFRNGSLAVNQKTALMWGVCEGNLEVVNWFLQNGGFCLLKDKYGRSAREWAIVLKARDTNKAAHYDAIIQAIDTQILQEYQNIATTQFPTPDYISHLKVARLRIACQRGELEIAKQLLAEDPNLLEKEFDETGDCALISAVKHTDEPLFTYIMTYNVDVLKTDKDGNTALDIANKYCENPGLLEPQRNIYKNFIKKLEQLKQQRDLEEAIIAGQLAKVKLLVNSELINHPIGLQKLKPLELAAKYDRIEIITFLLSHCGANPEGSAHHAKSTQGIDLISGYQFHEAHFQGMLEDHIQMVLKQLTAQVQMRMLAPLQAMLELISAQAPHFMALLQQQRAYPKLELLCLLKELLHIAATAADEIQLQQLLQALFAKRETLIKGTDWDYCSSRSPSNQLCIALAQKFFPTQPPLKILWATALSDAARQNKPWQDFAVIMLEQPDPALFNKPWHTLRTARNEIHQYHWVVNRAIEHLKAGENTLSSIWIGTDLLHNNKPNLTSPEWLTLAQRSPSLNKLLQYTMRLEDAVNNPTTPLAALEALCSGLRQGDYHNNGDNHVEAGSAALIAAARFGEWFNSKTPDFQNKVRAVGDGKAGRVIDVVLGTKLRSKHDATYCVALKANALENLLNQEEVKKELTALGKADLRFGVTDQQLDQWQQQIETELAATPNVESDMVGRGDLDIAASTRLYELMKHTPEKLDYQSLHTINNEEGAKALLQQKLQELQGKMISNQHTNRKHVLNFVFSMKDYFRDCTPNFKEFLYAQILEFLNHSRFDTLLRKHNSLSLCYAYQRNQWTQTSETWLLITAAIALEKGINAKKVPQAPPPSPDQANMPLKTVLNDMGWYRKRNMSKIFRNAAPTRLIEEVQQEVRNLTIPVA